MASNAVFFAWNRSLPGRERISAEHFDEFVKFVEGLKGAGTIESYDAVFLDNHGGDLNGFFLLRGNPAKLDSLVAGDEWVNHMLRASMHLDGSGAVRAHSGPAVMERMQAWIAAIPG